MDIHIGEEWTGKPAFSSSCEAAGKNENAGCVLQSDHDRVLKCSWVLLVSRILERDYCETSNSKRGVHLGHLFLWVLNGFSCDWCEQLMINQGTHRKCLGSFSFAKVSITFNMWHFQLTYYKGYYFALHACQGYFIFILSLGKVSSSLTHKEGKLKVVKWLSPGLMYSEIPTLIWLTPRLMLFSACLMCYSFCFDSAWNILAQLPSVL